MRIILYVYAGFYLLFSVSAVLDDIKDQHPFWRTGTDAALAQLASLGMVFYFLEVKNYGLILVWRPISLMLLGGQIFINFYERHSILAGKYPALDGRTLSRRALWLTDLFTMFIVLPAIIINLIFAYF